VYSSQLVNSVTELLAVTSETPKPTPLEYRIVYRTKADFRIFAKKLEIMEDFKVSFEFINSTFNNFYNYI
jgi:hypothetical protein